MTTAQIPHLIQFLHSELNLPDSAIAIGLERTTDTPNLLPIVLWQYGLVNTSELAQIFDWVEIQCLSIERFSA